LSEYLALDDAARRGKTPYVSRRREDGVDERFVVDPALVRVCAERSQAWRLLQELAGLVTPFTARVRQEARDEVARDHEEEIAAVRAEYEARIAALQDEMIETVRKTMRERMMSLAGYSGSPEQQQGAG